MKAYKIKCNSYCQREEIFNFNGEECDLDEEILSEGSKAKSAVFESNMQLNMEKVSFKTKKMMISEKGLQLDKRSRDSMILERSHAVDLSGELLQIRVATNRPFLSTKGYGESKSNNSSAKVNSSCSSPTTLKDEIRQLLRCLANKRNSSTFKAECKDSNVTSNRDNKEQYNLLYDYSSASLRNSSVNRPRDQRNILNIKNYENPEEITMSNVLPSINLDEIFC